MVIAISHTTMHGSMNVKLYFKYIYVSNRKGDVLPKECYNKRPDCHTAYNMSAFRLWERKASYTYIGIKNIRNNLNNCIEDWFSKGYMQGTLFCILMPVR